ncbi:MAG: PhoH family protein [Myxococcota bacterium]|nr:PhoH family protein [Myxococcota bacterium]
MTREKHRVEEVSVPRHLALLPELFGPQDAFRRYLERRLSLKISVRGERVSIAGPDGGRRLGVRVIQEMLRRTANGATLFLHDIDQLVTVLEGDQTVDFAGLDDEVHDGAEGRGRVRAKTPNQKLYLDALEKKELVFATGPAGTGKTYLAMAAAVNALLSRQVERIILARPAVEAGERLGFLPGSLVDKVNPYLRPLHDALFDLLGIEHAGRLMDNGTIEVAPLAFMRGRTLSRAFVVLDEAQNTTTEQMKMFLTRLGHGSFAVVTGDITQVDLPRGQQSGLVHAVQILKNIDDIGFIELQRSDVVRHGLVRSIVAAYDEASKSTGEGRT